VTSEPDPVILITSGRGAQAKTQKIKLANFVELMGWRAVGAKLFDYNKSVSMDWEIKKNKKGDNQPELF
jgi:topoisomerase-4 subunit A